MSILQDLNELVSANLISEVTAQQITDYYKKKQVSLPSAKNKQLLIFGILGAILIGIGLMFIIANQWDELPQMVKTTCAFLLLIVPQLLCFYVLYKKADKEVWRESAAVLLFFAVGANISLVSQIYHISGDASSFLLTWLLLTIPLVYILDASAVSIAYLFCAMFYAFAVRPGFVESQERYLFWLLFLLPLPRYIRLSGKSPESILLILHHWVIPFVLTLTLGTLSRNAHELMPPLFMAMFAIFYLLGNHSIFRNKSLLNNGYRIFGRSGAIITILVMSFKFNWEKLTEHHYTLDTLLVTPEFIANVVLFAIAFILLYRQVRNKSVMELGLFETTFLLFVLILILGFFTTFSSILVNLLVFVSGILLIRDGSKGDSLKVVNTGMLIIALLVACRSFDTGLTFVVKGSLFVLVGIGFFVANWLMLKKRKENEE